MINKFRPVIVLIGIVVVIFGLSCSPGAYSGPVESITLGTVLQEPSIPIFVAEDQQFFAQNGLKVTFKYYDSGAQAISGVLQNEVNILAPTSEYILLSQVLNKETIQTIGSIDKLDFVIVIGRKDHRVTAISDLKGKNIGLVRGTATEFYLARFLTLKGLDLQDVTLVNMASNPQTVNAIVTGDVDAIISVSPYTEEALAKLGDNAVSWPAQGSQMLFQLAVGQKEWVSSHPALVERFLKSMNQAEEFIAQHPKDAKAIAKKKLNLNDDEVSQVWARNQFSLSLDQSLITAMEDETRWMIANGLTTEKTVPDFNNYIYEDALKAIKPNAVNITK
jgi:ABC-type nitrate/sulfonate/bicarbonate transport system substrate-binding protein